GKLEACLVADALGLAVSRLLAQERLGGGDGLLPTFLADRAARVGERLLHADESIDVGRRHWARRLVLEERTAAPMGALITRRHTRRKQHQPDHRHAAAIPRHAEKHNTDSSEPQRVTAADECGSR